MVSMIFFFTNKYMFRFSLLVLVALSSLARAATDPNFRLNSKITPIHYSIVITPYFDTQDDRAFTFDGEVSIALETNENNINKIRLHSEELIFGADNVTVASDSSVVALRAENPVEFITNYQFVDINLATSLEAGVQYTLTILYRGPIRSDLNGFYRSYYFEDGVKKWLGATQFETTHARKAFPSFDEPQYKAIFSLTIDRPSTYSLTLANTKLQSSVPQSNDMIRDTFQPTPKMSTYLIAFLVSDFVAADYSFNGTNEFGIFTRADAANQTDYAFDIGMRVESALSKYFGIDYYSTNANLKLDHAAIPDFRAGAMENWGLIKYREALLLYDPDQSSPLYKYRIAQIMAHETTHMWFGNLVTCHWWSDAFLNEGFANYFQDYITAMVEPEVGSADLLVIGSVYSAYNADETPLAVPVSNENVNSPSESSGHFGTITYQKAGSIIRMIHHLIGDEAFKFGLNNYLTTNQFDVGTPAKLYDALDKGVSATGSLTQYPGVTVTEVMDSWISQPGHPLLQVEVNYETGNITLTQKRFYTTAANETDEIYMIPLTYTTGEANNFEETKPSFIMTGRTGEIHEPALLNNTWVLFNIQETGFYRVNYDSNTWQRITQLLKNNITNVHYYNRAKIVNDLFALLTADEVTFNSLHDVLGFLTQETSYSVWYAAISGFNNLRTRYIGQDDVLKELDAYILNIMDNIIKNLGFKPDPTDSFLRLRNRMQVLEFACKLGHVECISNAVSLFNGYKNSHTSIPPSLRSVAYCFGLKHGEDGFDFLWDKMLTTNVANEALVIENALGCSKEKPKQKEYLERILKEDSFIRGQDVDVPITSVLSDHDNVDTVMDFVNENFDELKKIETTSIQSILGYVAAALHTDEQFEEFEDFLERKDLSEEIKESSMGSLNKAKAATAWATTHRNDILRKLRNSSVNLMPSLTILLASMGVVAMNFL